MISVASPKVVLGWMFFISGRIKFNKIWVGANLYFCKKISGLHSSENTKWFEEWFDSDHYHLLYGHRNEEEADLFTNALLRLLQPAAGAAVLDMACGRGRHSFSLFKKGLKVTGIDLSARNIAFAKQQEMDGLQFFIHDMRKPFRVNYYDIALNLFTSIGYFDRQKEDADVVKAAAMGLNSGGFFVIDFMNASKVLQGLVKKENKTVDGILFTIEREFTENIITKKITFTCEGKEHCFIEKVRALRRADFESFFLTAGLKTLHLFGDYSLGPYDEKNSPRLILVAQKIPE